MKPAPFDYLPARSVAEAVEALARHRDEAKVLAGGQSLVPMLNIDRKSTRLNSSHIQKSRMPSSA